MKKEGKYSNRKNKKATRRGQMIDLIECDYKGDCKRRQ